MDRIPFLPVTVEKARALSRRFLGIGEMAEKMFPSLSFHLHQGNIPLETRQWLGLAFIASALYGGLVFLSVFAIVFAGRMVVGLAVGLGMAAALAVGSSVFLYFSMYPRLLVRRKVKRIEENLTHVLHHMLIQVRSGVPIFNTMNSVVSGGYGKLSEEFERVVKDVTTGKSEVDALEELAVNNPSLYFRRVVWQIVNAMKSGADIGSVLKEIVDNLTMDQKTAIKKYGSELNPLSLFYMMLVVIFPTLGIVFLLIMLSFVGVAINLEWMLAGLLVLLIVIQIMFAGMIKGKRPVGL